MTVTTDSGVKEYTANGTQTFFAFGFVLPAYSTVLVLVDTEVVTNYTIQATGILFDVAPANGAIIRITRDSTAALNQLRNWRRQGDFDPEKTELALDKLIILKQEAEYLALMNLSISRTNSVVTVLNDKGDDAPIGMWSIDGSLAGVFSGLASTVIPADGAETTTPEGYWHMQHD